MTQKALFALGLEATVVAGNDDKFGDNRQKRRRIVTLRILGLNFSEMVTIM